MSFPVPSKHRNARRAIEKRIGRPLGDFLRDLYCDRGRPLARIAGICGRLAGEHVGVEIVREWLVEYGLMPGEDQWAVMVPRLNRLLDKLIEEEADRRLKERSSRPS